MNYANETETKVLVVDDDPKIQYAFQEVLRKEGHIVILANSGEEALKVVQSNQIDIIFLDISLPHINGLEVLNRFNEMQLNIPTIIITGNGIMQNAVKAMQLGAFDYLTKPLDINRIRELIQKALSKSASDYDDSLSKYFPSSDNFDRYSIIGKSTAMQEVFKLIGMVSTTPNTVPVLISGESGTGKELVAGAIHHHSERAGKPIVIVNCSALSESLLESELFGHVKGAFTGAHRDRAGRFEQASGGTIFLDEIGEISPFIQVKLLRVLQEREIERVGESKRRRIDIRIITATQQDLYDLVSQGHFRDDLYYRLKVFPIHLPPLRRRKEDIPLLVNHFIRHFNQKTGMKIQNVSQNAMRVIMDYDWPGNVRELENAIEHAFVLCTADQIDIFDLPVEIRRTGYHPASLVNSISKNRPLPLSDLSRERVIEALHECSWNKAEASRRIGLNRTVLWRYMKKWDIPLKKPQ